MQGEVGINACLTMTSLLRNNVTLIDFITEQDIASFVKLIAANKVERDEIGDV